MPEVRKVPKSIQEWIQEGEELYNASLSEFHALEAQLEELEARLAAKQSEVNRIAGIIGKPPVEGNRRLTAQLVTEGAGQAHTAPNSRDSIARALTGRGIHRS